MPILGFSNPAANKDVRPKYGQMGIKLSDWVQNIVEKEKLLVTSNFSFSRNVFISCLLLMRQNEFLRSKGLNDPDCVPMFIECLHLHCNFNKKPNDHDLI